MPAATGSPIAHTAKIKAAETEPRSTAKARTQSTAESPMNHTATTFCEGPDESGKRPKRSNTRSVKATTFGKKAAARRERTSDTSGERFTTEAPMERLGRANSLTY
jgi:hypothetical protein